MNLEPPASAPETEPAPPTPKLSPAGWCAAMKLDLYTKLPRKPAVLSDTLSQLMVHTLVMKVISRTTALLLAAKTEEDKEFYIQCLIVLNNDYAAAELSFPEK